MAGSKMEIVNKIVKKFSETLKGISSEDITNTRREVVNYLIDIKHLSSTWIDTFLEAVDQMQDSFSNKDQVVENFKEQMKISADIEEEYEEEQDNSFQFGR